MTRKDKGSKHEKARRSVPASASRPPATAGRLGRQTQPHPAELPDAVDSSDASRRLLIHSDVVEPDTLDQFEFQVVESHETSSYHALEMESVESVTNFTDSSLEPYLPTVQLSDRAVDLVYRCAEEQVALAMLEAEQATALCQWSGDVSPPPLSDNSFGLARPHPLLPRPSSRESVASMDGPCEDGPFAFDHI